MRSERMRVLTAVLMVATVVAACSGDGDHRETSGEALCCPVCGDGVCSGDETGCSCGDDCAGVVCVAILPTCGDGVCETSASPGESHERCAPDCPLDCMPCDAAG